MSRIELMKSMINLNERNNNRKLGLGEKVWGIILMSLQTKKQLEGAEFKLRAWVLNKEAMETNNLRSQKC